MSAGKILDVDGTTALRAWLGVSQGKRPSQNSPEEVTDGSPNQEPNHQDEEPFHKETLRLAMMQKREGKIP